MLKNLKEMIEDLHEDNLNSVYNLVWSLTAKDMLYQNATNRLEQLNQGQ